MFGCCFAGILSPHCVAVSLLIPVCLKIESTDQATIVKIKTVEEKKKQTQVRLRKDLVVSGTSSKCCFQLGGVENNPKLAPTSNYDASTKIFFFFPKGKGMCRCINSYSFLLPRLRSSDLEKNSPPLKNIKKKNCQIEWCQSYAASVFPLLLPVVYATLWQCGKLTLSIYQNKSFPQQDEHTALGPGDKKKKNHSTPTLTCI